MSKITPQALQEAFQQASQVIQSSFVPGSAGTVCRNGGWHINQVEKKDYGLSVKPLAFIPESDGILAYNQALNKHRQAYAQKLLKN